MSRNIWDQSEEDDVNGSEDIPEFPEETPTLAVHPESEEDFAELDARIAELEAEENLDGMNTTILNVLRKTRAEARSAG